MFGVVLVHYFKEFIFFINVNSEFELLPMILFIIKFFYVLLLDGEPGNIPNYETHSWTDSPNCLVEVSIYLK